MQACTTANLAASLALALAFSFAGCSGNKPEPATPAGKSDPAGAAAGSDGAGATAADPAGASGDGEKAPASAGGDKGDDTGGEPATGDAETRTTDVIQKLVQDNRKPVRECYEKARKSLPDLEGMMTIHFVLDPEGKVKKAELNQERSQVKSPEVVNCAIDVIKKIKFPPSSRGMESTINYPFNFKP